MSNLSVLGIAHRSPSSRADGSCRETSGVARPLPAGEHPALAFLHVGRAGYNHQDGQHADGGGEAGADQPPETAALPGVGVIADIDVTERATGPVDMRMPAAMG